MTDEQLNGWVALSVSACHMVLNVVVAEFDRVCDCACVPLQDWTSTSLAETVNIQWS